MAEKPRGMRLKFVLSQLRTCTHKSKNMFVFFKSLRFYGEQESVESNPEKLGEVFSEKTQHTLKMADVNEHTLLQ